MPTAAQAADLQANLNRSAAATLLQMVEPRTTTEEAPPQ
jgi:hypothetical protein